MYYNVCNICVHMSPRYNYSYIITYKLYTFLYIADIISDCTMNCMPIPSASECDIEYINVSLSLCVPVYVLYRVHIHSMCFIALLLDYKQDFLPE